METQRNNAEKTLPDYELLLKQIDGFAEADRWYVPLLCNVSSLIMDSLEDLNWAGFYLMRGGQLVVGPFQGKPACIHIAPGRGVCGTAVQNDAVQNVPDVHAFPGHIPCDSASNSEIVIPIHREGAVIGVLDIDSPLIRRFSDRDQEGLCQIVRFLEKCVDWDAL